MKILVLAHGHPRKHKGGGEVAAYSLHQQLLALGHDSIFVGWGGFEADYSEPLEKLSDHEYEIYTSCNFFDFSAGSENLGKALNVLLNLHQPDVVHLHHYVHLGIEAAAFIKRSLPRCKVVLTLHEYLAICMSNGQMLNAEKEPCSGFALDRCVKCFPQHTEADFFRRRLSVFSALSFIDTFIAPSEFLRAKYIEWGVSPEKIFTIENPIPSRHASKPARMRAPRRGEPWILGFFGQINYYKGLDIIAEGVIKANQAGFPVHLNIHGKFSNVTGQEYIDQLQARLQDHPEFLFFHGPYSQDEVATHMGNCHFVVMGSRWYENSPVVIREAIAAARPIIAPELGGMAEKVGGLGIFFAAGSSDSLSRSLMNLDEIQFDDLSVKMEEAAAFEKDLCMTSLGRIEKLYSI